jgi:hypothetical protein
MPESIIDHILTKVFSDGGLSEILMFAAIVWLAWQRALDRKARIEADTADREFAHGQTEALQAVAVALARIEGFLTSDRRY